MAFKRYTYQYNETEPAFLKGSGLPLSDSLQKLVSRGARSENLERVSLSSRTAKQTEDAMLSLGHLGPSWAVFGRLGAILGHLGPSLGRLGAMLGHLGAVLGLSWGHLGPSWAVLEPSWGHLGPS